MGENDEKFRQLEGWVALSEAAERMGLSKQGLHFRLNQGLIPAEHVRWVPTGSRKVMLVREAYIEEIEKEAVPA